MRVCIVVLPKVPPIIAALSAFLFLTQHTIIRISENKPKMPPTIAWAIVPPQPNCSCSNPGFSCNSKSSLSNCLCSQYPSSSYNSYNSTSTGYSNQKMRNSSDSFHNSCSTLMNNSGCCSSSSCNNQFLGWDFISNNYILFILVLYIYNAECISNLLKKLISILLVGIFYVIFVITDCCI